MQVVSVEQALSNDFSLFVDVRSPSEFEQGHIPGAINIPLLEDDERAVVGTLYKQQGPAEARQTGLEIISPKLSDMVGQVAGLLSQNISASLVVYCWRGGMRSKSILTILALMGISGDQLAGGYKAYRQYVQTRLLNFSIQAKIIVLCGSTGAGKTILLQRLAQLGLPVIDLEMLANHRGSAFGQVGRGKSATTYNFDANLLQLLDRYNHEPYIVVECESKRIGNIYLPEVLYKSMQTGRRILTKATMTIRVQRLIDEYTNVLKPHDPEIMNSIVSLTKKLGKKKVSQLITDYEAGNLSAFTETLLEGYYDPLYGYEAASPDSFDLVVDTEDIDRAAGEIEAYIGRLKRG